MKKIIVLFLIIGIISCKSTSKASKVDQSNPQTVAQAVLNFYKKKDLESLKFLSTTQNADILNRMILTKDEAAQNQLFSGWRWDKINGWDGKIKEVRFSDNLKTAFALFDLPENATADTEISVISLVSENKQWKFEDIRQYDKKSFDALGYVME